MGVLISHNEWHLKKKLNIFDICWLIFDISDWLNTHIQGNKNNEKTTTNLYLKINFFFLFPHDACWLI